MKSCIIVCLLALVFALIGCDGNYQPTSPPLTAPVVSPTTSRPTATPTIELTPFHEDPIEEKRAMLTAEPTPTLTPGPGFPDLPDLTSPPGGWIAFQTPEEHLSLISPDGSQRITVTEQVTVDSFGWSPDGRKLAFALDGQLSLISIEDSRFVSLTEQAGQIRHFAWSPDGHWVAFIIRQKGSRGGQLNLVSIENPRPIPLTPLDAVRSIDLIWSRDSQHLAYLHSLGKPDALRVLDITTRDAITVSTYTNARPSEMAFLSSQPFPFPLLGVAEAGFNRTVRIWDVRDRQVLTTIHPPSFRCHYLWLPHTPGLVFAREETEKPGIEWTCLQATQVCMKGETKLRHPTSVVLWRMAEDSVGDEAPTVVLEGEQKRHYYPTRWLPDGRLEVRVSHFEKTAYEGPAQPARVTYRYLTVTEEGALREADGGDLPWWAAGGFTERFETTDLYQEQTRENPMLPSWNVGPDGETVTFAWTWRVEAEAWASAIYVWRGEGEPKRLAMGSSPQWQLGAPSSP